MLRQMKNDNNCSSRNRVKLAIRHGKTERLPTGEIVIDDAAVMNSLQCDKAGFEQKLAFTHKLGMDIISISPSYPSQKDDLPTIRDCVFPDLKDWVLKTELFTFALLDGVFGWGTRLLGFNRFITLPQKSPLSFSELIKKVEEFNIELAVFLTEQGIDGFIIADDLAYNRGLLISPAVVREHIFPSLTGQVEQMNRGDIPVFFHSDGNLNQIMRDIIQAGFAGLHCIDSKAGMDLLKLQQEYGNELCFWGHLGVDDVTRSHDLQYLEQLKKTIRTAAARKGFILGTNSGIFKGYDIDGLMNIYNEIKFLC